MRNFAAADLKIFGASFFEDEVYGGVKQINVESILHAQTDALNGITTANSARDVLNGEKTGSYMSKWDAFDSLMYRRPRFVRALIWMLLDFDLFKKKARNKLKKFVK